MAADFGACYKPVAPHLPTSWRTGHSQDLRCTLETINPCRRNERPIPTGVQLHVLSDTQGHAVGKLAYMSYLGEPKSLAELSTKPTVTVYRTTAQLWTTLWSVAWQGTQHTCNMDSRREHDQLAYSRQLSCATPHQAASRLQRPTLEQRQELAEPQVRTFLDCRRIRYIEHLPRKHCQLHDPDNRPSAVVKITLQRPLQWQKHSTTLAKIKTATNAKGHRP